MPLDSGLPSPQSFITFGELLRYLRERAHLSQRALAALVGYHFSYISYLEKNTRSIDVATLFGRFVPALGLEDTPEWVARLIELSKVNKDESVVAQEKSKAVSVEAKINRLPINLTSLIGREYESARLRKMILNPDTRLVSVLGPPGVGKTSLSLSVARTIQAVFTGGVVFVDLASVRESQLFFPTVALALGVTQKSHTSIEESVKTLLNGKDLLLILDNFEQIVESSPQILSLFLPSSNLKVLVTSREALRLRGENEFLLEPLPIPDESKKNSSAQLHNFPSVSLFIERAQAVKPEFRMDEKNASHIAEICSRLDGLPLAIELAAARIRTLSLPSMLEQLDHRFEWLTQGARDLPEWRQTLLGAIEWSYNLLTKKEQTLFYRLSIFSGGWSLEAAQEICSDDQLCPRAEILNLLMQLVDKSLVVPNVEEDRYNFLETLREFSLQKINESSELKLLQKKHGEYYLKFAQTARPNLLQGNNQLLWLHRMESEHNNLRAALACAVEILKDAQSAMDLGYAIHAFWLTRSYINEARHWLGKILVLDPSPTEIRANLLRYASDYAASQGDYTNAHVLEEEAMGISKTLGDEAGIYYSLDGMAMLAGMQGDYAKASELLEQVLVYRRQMNDMLLLTGTLNNLAIATRRLNDFERAKLLYLEVIKIARDEKNNKSLAHALHGLAEIHMQMNDYDTAIQLHRESLSIRHQLGDFKGIAVSLNSIAMSNEQCGNQILAVQLESAAAKIRQELGVKISPATLAENENFLKRLRAVLGDETFDATWVEGQSLLWEQVYKLVLEGNLC